MKIYWAVIAMLICPTVALADPPTVGAPARPIRDTDICPTQAEAYDIGHLRYSDPMQASKIASAAHCSLALADDTSKSIKGRQAIYRVIMVMPGQTGLALVSQDTSQSHLTGFAIESDFESTPETPSSLAKKGIDWVLSIDNPIGCISPKSWHEMMADPIRKYQTLSSTEKFLSSYGCKTIFSTPGSVWQLVKKTGDGSLLRMHCSGTSDDLYYRSDVFSPLD